MKPGHRVGWAFGQGSRGFALSCLRRARSDLADETLDCAVRHISSILPVALRLSLTHICSEFTAHLQRKGDKYIIELKQVSSEYVARKR